MYPTMTKPTSVSAHAKLIPRHGYDNVLNLIGHTQLLDVEGIQTKLEFQNPSGSTKDRIAKYIIEKAEHAGLLKKGMKVVEATSGNSGIAFAMVCAVKGYSMEVLMPEGLTNERCQLIKAYGAKCIYTPKEKSVWGAVEKEKEYAQRDDYYAVSQFENEWNIEAHKLTLGKELTRELDEIDAFVAGVGTGGTLIGVGQALREKFPDVKLFAVEPEESQVIAGKKPEEHNIEGIGDGFVPEIYERNKEMIDGVIAISSKDAINETKRLNTEHGIFAGISSGANMLAAKKLQKKYKNVVTVYPDNGYRYLSMGFY